MCTLRLIKYPLRLISDPYALLSTQLYGLLGSLRLLSTLEYLKNLNKRGARLSAVLAVRRLLGTPFLRRSVAYCAHRSFAAIFPLTRKFVRRRKQKFGSTRSTSSKNRRNWSYPRDF